MLSLVDVPAPEITRDTGLLVRLKAAGVNPIDTKLRAKGTYFPERMPAILGCDGAGVVEAVGSGASRFKPGDAGSNNQKGQLHLTCRSDETIPMPIL